jgi:hypothetical protein
VPARQGETTSGGNDGPPTGKEEPATDGLTAVPHGDPAPGDRVGGPARAGAGGHSGGVYLASGGSGRPILGEVAGFRGSEVAGEATGRDRGRGVVFCARGEVVKFVNYFNLTLSYRRGEEELTGAKEGGDAKLG